MVTNTKVNKSGGVIIAATSIIIINACFLYFAKCQYERKPIFVNTKIIIGN